MTEQAWKWLLIGFGCAWVLAYIFGLLWGDDDDDHGDRPNNAYP